MRSHFIEREFNCRYFQVIPMYFVMDPESGSKSRLWDFSVQPIWCLAFPGTIFSPVDLKKMLALPDGAFRNLSGVVVVVIV